ncbi:23S rRNA (adenine(2503)-C(2))-methyltransferase RlmN [Patescibacteria group bacterium]
MDSKLLEKTLAESGERPFRLKQARAAVHGRLVSSWDEATDLPAALRESLAAEVPVSSVEPAGSADSSRGDSTKTAFRLHDGAVIEAVLMRHRDGRNTVCVSSQAGCRMGCTFCATGKLGFVRDLTEDEIVDQALHFARKLNSEGARLSNVVLMGMGEPFENYDAAVGALKAFNSADGLNLAARRLSVSTCGLVPGIRRFAAEPLQANLAVSLHAPDDETRSRLMPANRLHPLEELMPAVADYVAATNRKVMFEYLLIAGENDTDRHAEDLIALLAGNPLFHVNLIRFHRTGQYSPSPRPRRDAFLAELKQNGISATHRVSFGEDIRAACGMLAAERL